MTKFKTLKTGKKKKYPYPVRGYTKKDIKDFLEFDKKESKKFLPREN